MGVNNIGTYLAGDSFKPCFQLFHQGKFFAHRQAGQCTGRNRCTVETQAIDIFNGR